MKRHPFARISHGFALFGLLLTGCARTPATGQAALRVAVIPVLDSLPLHVAQQMGLFEKHGVQVELIPVGSAPERDQLIASNQADGMVNELLTTIFYNQEAVRVQAVRYARAASPDAPLFSILSAPGSGIETVDQLSGVPVGISDGTVIDYLTHRLLMLEGLEPAEIATVSVPGINDRMTLLGSGQLQAAMLPEPLTSLAVRQGATVVVDDTLHPEISFSVLTFRRQVLEENPEAVRRLLAAVEEAVAAINADPDGFPELLAGQKLVPEALLEDFVLPAYVTAGVPGEEQYNDVLSWALERGLITREVPYEQSVTAEFLPE